VQGGETAQALVIDLGTSENAPREVADEGAIRATVLRNPSTLVAQGTVIGAVLETPVDSTRGGPVRALTLEDARGFDGVRVLIPKGSRLLGESSGDVHSGQSRVLITWTRLIRPDGVTIRIGSPASDSLGGAGISGHVNNHTFAKISNAVLQTALIAGAEVAARPSGGGVFVGLPSQVVTTTGQTFLVPGSDLNHPTITVRAGAPIMVFVAHDLDFAGTPRWP
jgi:type IV secretion system protein VirB10